MSRNWDIHLTYIFQLLYLQSARPTQRKYDIQRVAMARERRNLGTHNLDPYGAPVVDTVASKRDTLFLEHPVHHRSL